MGACKILIVGEPRVWRIGPFLILSGNHKLLWRKVKKETKNRQKNRPRF